MLKLCVLGLWLSLVQAAWEWKRTGWTSCRPCGTGALSRGGEVVCWATYNRRVAMDDLCINSGPKPNATETCPEEQPCVEASKTSWSDCTYECGGGVRTREVNCTLANGTAVDSFYCGTLEDCNTQPCQGGPQHATAEFEMEPNKLPISGTVQFVQYPGASNPAKLVVDFTTADNVKSITKIIVREDNVAGAASCGASAEQVPIGTEVEGETLLGDLNAKFGPSLLTINNGLVFTAEVALKNGEREVKFVGSEQLAEGDWNFTGLWCMCHNDPIWIKATQTYDNYNDFKCRKMENCALPISVKMITFGQDNPILLPGVIDEDGVKTYDTHAAYHHGQGLATAMCTSCYPGTSGPCKNDITQLLPECKPYANELTHACPANTDECPATHIFAEAVLLYPMYGRIHFEQSTSGGPVTINVDFSANEANAATVSLEIRADPVSEESQFAQDVSRCLDAGDEFFDFSAALGSIQMGKIEFQSDSISLIGDNSILNRSLVAYTSGNVNRSDYACARITRGSGSVAKTFTDVPTSFNLWNNDTSPVGKVVVVEGLVVEEGGDANGVIKRACARVIKTSNATLAPTGQLAPTVPPTPSAPLPGKVITFAILHSNDGTQTEDEKKQDIVDGLLAVVTGLDGSAKDRLTVLTLKPGTENQTVVELAIQAGGENDQTSAAMADLILLYVQKHKNEQIGTSGVLDPNHDPSSRDENLCGTEICSPSSPSAADEGGNGGTVAAIVIVVLLLIGLAAGGAWWWMNKRGNSQYGQDMANMKQNMDNTNAASAQPAAVEMNEQPKQTEMVRGEDGIWVHKEM